VKFDVDSQITGGEVLDDVCALLCCSSHGSSGIWSSSLDLGWNIFRVGNLKMSVSSLTFPLIPALLVQLFNQRTTNRDRTSNSRHGGKPLSRAKTTSPYLNDFDSAGPDFLAEAPELEPFVFFAPPEVEARAIFFLGCSPATVEEGRVLEDAGLASEASAA
jgi:hypothetical protein